MLKLSLKLSPVTLFILSTVKAKACDLKLNRSSVNYPTLESLQFSLTVVKVLQIDNPLKSSSKIVDQSSFKK